VAVNEDEAQGGITKAPGNGHVARLHLVDWSSSLRFRVIEGRLDELDVFDPRTGQAAPNLLGPTVIVLDGGEVPTSGAEPLGTASATPLQPVALTIQLGVEEADCSLGDPRLVRVRELVQAIQDKAPCVNGSADRLCEDSRVHEPGRPQGCLVGNRESAKEPALSALLANGDDVLSGGEGWHRQAAGNARDGIGDQLERQLIVPVHPLAAIAPGEAEVTDSAVPEL